MMIQHIVTIAHLAERQQQTMMPVTRASPMVHMRLRVYVWKQEQTMPAILMEKYVQAQVLQARSMAIARMQTAVTPQPTMMPAIQTVGQLIHQMECVLQTQAAAAM